VEWKIGRGTIKEKNNIWKWLGTSSVTQEKRSMCTSGDYITFNWRRMILCSEYTWTNS
jgi:hypothetical protein